MRPDALAWSVGVFPFSQALAIATLIGSLRYIANVPSLLTNPVSVGLLSLQLPIGASVLFAVDPALCYEQYRFYVTIIVMTLLIPLLVKSLEDLRYLLLVMALSLGFLGAKFGYGGLLLGGVQFTSGHEGFLSDNNTLALALVMVVPLCWYARDVVTLKWLNTLLLAIVFGTIGAIIMSNSRGGTVALAGVFLMILLRSRRRFRVILVLAVLSGPTIYMVHEKYFQRMATLQHTEKESSAASRIKYANAAYAMWKDYPVFGVGFGTMNQMALWPTYAGPDSAIQVVHNTYLQMLADSGIFAFLAYVGLLFGVILWLGISAGAVQREAHLAAYPIALQTSLVGFAIGSTFLSRVTFDFVYMLLMCAASWYTVQRSLPDAGKAADTELCTTPTAPTQVG